MSNKMPEFLKVVLKRYFCPETELFYDFVVDDDGNAWHHLPNPEQIARSYPNPCGWGTGMEDSAMNGGSALDGFIGIYNVTKDERLIPIIESIARGLLRCVSPGKVTGFVSRSILPKDGKSHYIESSRDQYTHLIFGLLRYYDSSLCSDGFKEKIRKAICEICSKCERDVTPENEYNMLREDGSIGIVNKMWEGLGTHEWSRLPMFYLSAYHVTGDKRYYGLYEKYIDEALEFSRPHKPETMTCYCTLQMQCALKSIYDYCGNEKTRSAVKEIMEANALFGQKTAIANSIEYSKPHYKQQIDYRFKPWDKAEIRNMGVHGGYSYDNPGQANNRVNPAFYPVREVAEGATVAALCPDFKVTSELVEAVVRMAEAIDIEKHSSIYSPLLLPCAYYLCLEKKQ